MLVVDISPSMDEGTTKLKNLVALFRPLLAEYQRTVGGKTSAWVGPLKAALEDAVKVIAGGHTNFITGLRLDRS